MRKQEKIFAAGLFIFLILIFRHPLSDLLLRAWWKLPPTPLRQVTVSQPFYSRIKSAGCDNRLWDHVYLPQRLFVIKDCVFVEGIIDKVEVEPDGDNHMDIRLDEPYRGLVDIFNQVLMGGDLITEIICQTPRSDKEISAACSGYINKIEIPKVGEHVKITGTLVTDKTYGWIEIHPISKIEILSR